MNFVWLDDTTIQAELSRRVPGYNGVVAIGSLRLAQVRSALTAILREKGIIARVVSVEPAASVTIHLEVDSPRIEIAELTIDGAPSQIGRLLEIQHREQGVKYDDLSAGWALKKDLTSALVDAGYLEASVDLRHGTPLKTSSGYSVVEMAEIKPGPLYHVKEIDLSNPGLLLQGRDLSRFITRKQGDVAQAPVAGSLLPAVLQLYRRSGYLNAQSILQPTLDHSSAQVSYRLMVDPGLQYRLKSIEVQGLSESSRSVFLRAFPLKPGDVYDDEFVGRTSTRPAQITEEVQGLRYSWSPHMTPGAPTVDLVLSFFKN